MATSVVLQNVGVAPSQSSAQWAADTQARGCFCKAPEGNERSCLFGMCTFAGRCASCGSLNKLQSHRNRERCVEAKSWIDSILERSL